MRHLPEGVLVRPLAVHRDRRGWLAEIFRAEWMPGYSPLQWNVTLSEPNVLRGVHVHHKHTDHLVFVTGRFTVGMHDMRAGSPTFRLGAEIEVSGDDLTAISIPTGVAHGFFAHERGLYVYGVDSYFDPEDELGCRWSDPALEIRWPCAVPELSERDAAAGTLADLEGALAERRIRL